MALWSIKRMALALLVCGAGLNSLTGADAAEPIRVGAVLPFSGGVELYGQQAKARPRSQGNQRGGRHPRQTD